MDRREAIQKIEAIIDNGQDYGYWTDAQRKALDLAIEALGREIEYGQMVVDFTKDETMKSDEWKYDTTCDAESATTTDLISRADTIKALCQECEMKCVCNHDCTEVAVVKGMPSVSEEELDYCNNCPYISFNNEDCISRQQVVEEIGRWLGYLDEDMIARIRIGIRNLPPITPPKKIVAQISIDTEELIERIKEEYEITNKVGEWVRRYCFQHWKCSECEYEIDGMTNYCPNCGAKMKR